MSGLPLDLMPPLAPTAVVCGECGSQEVDVPAWLRWNEVRQRFEVREQSPPVDHCFCHICESECDASFVRLTPEVGS